MHVVDFTVLTVETSAGEASGDESPDGGHSTSGDRRTLGSRIKKFTRLVKQKDGAEH